MKTPTDQDLDNLVIPRLRQPVMSLMFDARIAAMTKELRAMAPGELDQPTLAALHTEVCRLLHGSLPVLPEDQHEG